MKKPPPSALRSSQHNLAEAFGELEELWGRNQMSAFGEILAKEGEPRKE